MVRTRGLSPAAHGCRRACAVRVLRSYDSMVERSEELRRWWRDIRPLRQLPGVAVESIDECLQRVAAADSGGGDDEAQRNALMDRLFEVCCLRVRRHALVA